MQGKDDLTGLLQERFAEHELPVDPAVWDGVQGRLADAAMDADLDLFRDRFNGHESTVDPGIWQGIAGQLGHGAAAGTATGGGLLGGTGAWIGAGIAAVALTGGIWWWSGTSGPSPTAVVENEQVTMTPATGTATVSNKDVDPPELDNAAEHQAEGTVDATSETPTTPVPSPLGHGDDGEGPASQEDSEIAGSDNAEQGHTERDQPMPATLEPRLTSSDTGVQDPHGLEVVQRILGEAVSETAQHPRLEQEEVIPPPPMVVEGPDHVGEPPLETPVEMTTTSSVDELTLFIPNVFSPNNDLVNDELRVQGDGFKEVRVRIYNANNNQLVFAAESLKPWDGRDMNGQPCPDGFYFYAIEAVDLGGRLHSKGQAIRLFR